MYLLRLDDAADRWDKDKWHRMHNVLKQYGVMPIIAIIPNVEDDRIMQYSLDEEFDCTIKTWISEGWTPALHGYNHVLLPSKGGLNPVNYRSEFVGLSYEEQAYKIKEGYRILCDKGFNPKVFVSPAHSFDNLTLKAIKENTDIRVISDTIASDIYYNDGLYFIPQQSGMVREINLKIVTFCYHPNNMTDDQFENLSLFLEKNKDKFISFTDLKMNNRKKSIYDRALSFAYFAKRRISHKY